jgi:vancomycin permeability regulator SanA
MIVLMENASPLSRIASWIRARYKLLVGAACLVVAMPFALLMLAAALIAPSRQHILAPGDPKLANLHKPVGMVLGAGVTWGPNGRPYKELQSRLDVAAAAYKRGEVSTLILSGDNRLNDYNEPDAMRRYLTQTKGVPATALQPDYAGRSTYASCERASKVFGQRKLMIFSAASHLPRAIYLCRHFGVEAYGMASPVEANNSRRRERLARVKAVLNVYALGEPTILGPPIQVSAASTR